MTRDEAINAFADILRDMPDHELNNFYGQDSKHIWNYQIKKNKETGEWDVRMW